MAPRSPGGPLVVGGNGFLGRHVVAALAPLGALGTVRRGSRGGTEPVLDLLSTDVHELRTLLARVNPRAVVNCAGATVGTPEDLERANVSATGRLLDALTDAVPEARYVHLGSAAEYGPAGREGRSVSEEDEACPAAPYGVTKLAATRAVLGHAYEHGTDAVVLRVFNPVGAHAPVTTLPGRTAELIRQAGPDGPVTLGPLDAVRDFVDARDVASAVRACVEAETLVHTIYNVGSGRATSARDLVRALVAVSGHRGEVDEQRPAQDRSAAVSWQQADIRRLREELGWKPEYGLIDSVRALWEAS